MKQNFNIDERYLLLYDYERFKELVWDEDHQKIVIWSGGADSTLLMVELAIVCKAKHMNLNTISVDMDYIHQDKIATEKKCRKKLLKFLKSCGLDNIRESSITIKQSLDFYDSSSVHIRYPQQFLWGVIPLQLAPDNSDVFFGFIKEDEVWHCSRRQEFFDIFNRWHNLNLRFHDPYEYYTKKNVYIQLHELGLLKYIWTCETPTGVNEPCGTCLPCQHRRDTLFDLYMIGEKWAGKLLEKEFNIRIEKEGGND